MNYPSQPEDAELTRLSRSTVNVSIAAYPLQLLPGVFRYGYAMPFYNLSKTVLTLCFNTKNQSKSSQSSTIPAKFCDAD